MPLRHPQPGRGRARAGTVPTSFPTSPSPGLFPGRLPSRLRSDSQNTESVSSGYESSLSEPLDEPEEEEEHVEAQMMEQSEPEGPREAAEGKDSVGLLGVMPRSPRSSNASSRRRRGRGDSRTGLHASRESDSQSASILSRSRAGSAVRSRAQSLIQSLGATSRSSIELVQSISLRTRWYGSRKIQDRSPIHARSREAHQKWRRESPRGQIRSRLRYRHDRVQALRCGRERSHLSRVWVPRRDRQSSLCSR